jgi:hypothetical protein
MREIILRFEMYSKIFASFLTVLFIFIFLGKYRGTKCNVWFAVRNVCEHKIPANFAKFSHTRLEIGLQYFLMLNISFVSIRLL